jgi:cytochrome b561
MPDCRTKGNLAVSRPRKLERSKSFAPLPWGDSVTKVVRYHPLLVVLHWLLALAIIASLAYGALVMVDIPNASPMKIGALRIHVTLGILILVLMIFRAIVRYFTSHPPAASGSPALDFLALASHHLFYATVFALAGSGVTMALETGLFDVVYGGHGALPADFWAFPVRTAHYVLSRLLMALIAFHVLAALYRSFALRDGLLSRMSFGRRS